MAPTDRSARLVARCLALAFGLAWVGRSGDGGDGGSSTGWSGTVDAAADGRFTVTNTGGGVWTEDTVRARRTLLIGETGVSGGTEAPSDPALPTSQVHHWSPVTCLQVSRPLGVTCEGIV